MTLFTKYGYGHGDGSGYGHGDGAGYGFGYGDGSGYGDPALKWKELDMKLAGHIIEISRRWKLLKVGCQVHALPHWRTHWQEIADQEEVEISPGDAEQILAAAEKEFAG